MNGQVDQQDFWNSPPSPDDTALSLLVRTIVDTKEERRESPNFDSGVLKSILGLRTFFTDEQYTLELTSPSKPEDKLTLVRSDIEKAERLQRSTPEPRVFVIAGHLDKIAHKDRAFQIEVEGGKNLVGRVDSEFLDAESLRQLWGQRVSVKGLVHFHPSGAVQLVEAQAINAWEQGDEIFAQVPLPVETPLLIETAVVRGSHPNPFEQVRGQWPGEESIEELLQTLRGD